MGKKILYLLDIDNIGNRVAGKILFAFIFLVRCLTLLMPIGDSDFTAAISWSQKVVDDPNLLMTSDITDIPFTLGNFVFFFSELAIYFVMVAGALLYCGLYIRDYRIKLNSTKLPMFKKSISISKLVSRFFMLVLVLAILYVPFLILGLYLPIIFIIIFPCAIIYFACYLSGDKGIFDAIGETTKRMRGFYLLVSRDVCFIIMAYFIIELGLSYIGQYVPVVSYVVSPFFMAYLLLLLSRYAGFMYCNLVNFTITVVRKPTDLDNDASRFRG